MNFSRFCRDFSLIFGSYLDSLRAAAAGTAPANYDLENSETLQSPATAHDPETTQAAAVPDIDEAVETPASTTAQEPNNVTPVWFENRPTQRRRWRKKPTICAKAPLTFNSLPGSFIADGFQSESCGYAA